jgi:hypothetical protein
MTINVNVIGFYATSFHATVVGASCCNRMNDEWFCFGLVDSMGTSN